MIINDLQMMANKNNQHISKQSKQTSPWWRRGDAVSLCMFQEVVPGVFATDSLFTDRFRSEFLDELDSINASGIPTRRPNGMNRYGVILDEVGFKKMMESWY